MSVIGYQFEKMVVSPIKDAKLYYGLMGDVFYRNIESTDSGLFTSYTKAGDTVYVQPSTHIVAGRLVEITEEMNFYVPNGKTLAFQINLIPQNTAEGYPNTPGYSVTNNQLSLVVLPEYVSQLRYNEYKKEYNDNMAIEVITVPILNPGLRFQIETPVGTTHTITSAFDSYKYSAHAEILHETSANTSQQNSATLSQINANNSAAITSMSQQNSSTISQLNANNSAAATSMNSAFTSQTSKMNSDFSALATSTGSAFSSQANALSAQNSSQFTSLQSSVHTSLSNFAGSVYTNINENGREIFESVADIYVDPYISSHVGQYLEEHEIGGGDSLGFLAEDMAFTEKDGTPIIGYSEVVCTGTEFGEATNWQTVALYDVKINNSDEVIKVSAPLKFGGDDTINPITATIGGKNVTVGYTNIKNYPSTTEDINAGTYGINAKNKGDITVSGELITNNVTSVTGFTVAGDLLTTNSRPKFVSGWSVAGKYGQLQVLPLGFEAGGETFVTVRMTGIGALIPENNTASWKRVEINKSLPKDFSATMRFPCWINGNVSYRSMTILSTDSDNQEKPDMFIGWEAGVLNKQVYTDGKSISDGQLTTFEAVAKMKTVDFNELIKPPDWV